MSGARAPGGAPAARERAAAPADRAVRHADEHELGLVLAQLDAALSEARRQRRPDAAGADHLNRLDHRSSSSVADTGHVEAYRTAYNAPDGVDRSVRRCA